MQDPGTTPLVRARTMLVALAAAAIALVAAAAPATAAPVLAGQWTFDEPAGQAVLDSGPLGLHGVLGASAEPDAEDPLRIPGAFGGALRFGEGTNVRVADGRRLDLATLTVEAIARADGSPGLYRYLVAHGSIGCFSGAYGLYTASDGGLAFYVFDGERYHVSASARISDVWDGAWHRVTGTFDGRSVRVFVDGQEAGAPLVTPTGTVIESASIPEGTHFGSYVGGCRLPFTGDLDSVRIWSDGTSPATVAAQAGTAADVRLPAAARGSVIQTVPPRASCAVRVSRKTIVAKRRAVVTVRATNGTGPLRHVRLLVRRTNVSKTIARPRTNAKGHAKVALRVSTRGRLRIGVVGRPNCTPAFITVRARA